MQLQKESMKSFRFDGIFEPWPLRYWCSALFSWASKPVWVGCYIGLHII